MKKTLLGTLVLAFAMLSFAESGDEKAVRAAHQAFLDAAKAGDRAALENIFADGLQYSHSNARLENKQEAIEALVKSKGNFEVHSQTIRVYNNVATIRGNITAHPATGDIPLTMLQVWVKNGGKWQMVERHTTRLPGK